MPTVADAMSIRAEFSAGQASGLVSSGTLDARSTEARNNGMVHTGSLRTNVTSVDSAEGEEVYLREMPMLSEHASPDEIPASPHMARPPIRRPTLPQAGLATARAARRLPAT
jgi:hypothetical protein